jgi:hypothetical protein
VRGVSAPWPRFSQIAPFSGHRCDAPASPLLAHSLPLRTAVSSTTAKEAAVTSQIIFVALGGILILTGVIGGGFEVRELKIPQVKWPTRVVAFVAGFVLVFMGAGTSVSPDVPHVGGVLEASTRVRDVARETTPPEPPREIKHVMRVEEDAWLQRSLEAAVLKASDAEIRALRENNPKLLEGLVVGDAYDKMMAFVKSLASQELYEVHQLHDQQFDAFSVDPSGQRAEVRLTETWSSTQYSTRTNRCVRAFAPHRVPQTVSLERRGDRWILSDFTTYGAEPVEIRCP